MTRLIALGVLLPALTGFCSANPSLPVTVRGNGGVSFRVRDANWRRKVTGFVSKAPKFRDELRGEEQLWFVLWQGKKVLYFATDGVRSMFPKRADSETGLSRLAATPASAAALGVPLETAGKGVLSDLTVHDGILTHDDVLDAFRKWRKATLTASAHFGTAGREKKVTVAVRPGRVSDLAGAQIEFTDESGRAVAPARPVTAADGQVETYAVRLPFGDYLFRLTKGGVLLAEERYGVLSDGDPVILRGVDGCGRPNRMELVRTIVPDPAQLPTNAFRSVGNTHFGTLGGTRYLETGSRRWDRFVLRFAVDTNVPIHCLEFDYPDDRKRTMDILVQESRYGWNPVSRSGSDYTLAVGLATGGEEFACQNRILTHRCLFWTGPVGDVSLVVSSPKADAPAALSEIRLYRVTDGALPAAFVREPPPNGRGQRRFVGQFWEDPAVTRDFRVAHGTLRQLDTLINRHLAQMKYSGQNMLAYPGSWYQGLVAAEGNALRGHRRHFLEAYYEKFDRENTGLMPIVEQRCVPDGLAGFDARSLTNGALHATSYAIRGNGEAVPGWHGSSPNQNVAHPRVQDEIARVVTALADEGKEHPSFKGVTLFLPSDVCTWWGTVDSGYNDSCIEAFERETGERVRGEGERWKGPLRGKQYFEKIKGDPSLYAKWVQWRCDVVTGFYAHLAKILSDRRADLVLRLDVEPPVDVMRDLAANADFFTDALRPRLMREAGIDEPALRRRIPNLVFGAVVNNLRQRKRDYWLTDPKVRERYIRLPETEPWWAEALASAFPSVVVRDDFWESDVGVKSVGARSLNCDWFREISWRVSAILPSAHNAMKYFVLPLRYGDVMGVSRGGFLICDYGMEEAEVAFAKAFRALPAVKMSDWPCETDAPAFVRVRTGVADGRRFYYAVNTDAKPAKVSFAVETAVADTVSGRRHADRVSLALSPYEFRSFAVVPVDGNISNRAVSIMEETALKSDLGVCDALIFGTACERGELLLSGNKKHFKEVSLLSAREFRQ